ncbi:Phosphate transport system permease protein PstC [Planctomycetes bacterium Pan216]|uniref:Phosphate transport system permease protein n=1 Tax=Kolteria novifilia TaxID=2527975 RepID=A0A518B4W4_9BACT|nr:Phosphate transport system permease protein PstC [Planctomycetes bacterium Pan216]
MVSHSRPPSRLDVAWDRGFRFLTWFMAWATIALVLFIVYKVTESAFPALQRYGFSFMTTSHWDSNREKFGVLPEIWGTLYSSGLALLFATIFGVGVAIFVSEDFVAPAWRTLLKNVVELLAAIPSVVYGLWGIYVVIPLIRPMADWLHNNLGDFPLFGTPFAGPGMLPAAIVLAIMVLPTIAAVSRDALVNVPPRLREGAIGLGATRWEAIFKIVLPAASTGIFGAIVLGFGRALGETMALAMLVGNSGVISVSVLSPANTLSALLANHFPEAQGIEVGALMYAALVLMGITLLVNVIGELILWRASAGMKGAH